MEGNKIVLGIVGSPNPQGSDAYWLISLPWRCLGTWAQIHFQVLHDLTALLLPDES
jgi:hypothetical protein